MAPPPAFDDRQHAAGRATTTRHPVRIVSGCIGRGPKWSSRSAMSNGRRTVCSGMSSTWASARISWPARCAAAHLIVARLIAVKLAPEGRPGDADAIRRLILAGGEVERFHD